MGLAKLLERLANAARAQLPLLAGLADPFPGRGEVEDGRSHF